MREQLIQYVNALFAGERDKEDVKDEILQNTLDRYDDLVAQGKTQQAAYSLAIAGIGDVSEILGCASAAQEMQVPQPQAKQEPQGVPTHKKLLRAVAVALYICCVLPVIVLAQLGLETIGICLMFVMIAAATALIIMSSGGSREQKQQDDPQPRKELHKAVGTITGLVSLILYLTISFATGAWHITWLIFPVAGAVDGIIKGFMDLKRSTGSAVARIIIYFIVALLSLTILVAFLGYDLFVFTDDAPHETVTNQQTFEADTIRDLEIEWAAGSITIITADTDEITVTETGKFSQRYDMVCTTSDGNLQIEYAKSSAVIGVGSTPVKDLTVTVPEDWTCYSLELDAAAVEVSVSGLCAETVELDGAAMEFTFDGSLRTLSCDGAACRITAVMAEAPESIDVDGAACVIDLTLPEDRGFRVRMEGLACEFNTDRAFTGGAGLWTSGDESCLIRADGIACALTIH